MTRREKLLAAALVLALALAGVTQARISTLTAQHEYDRLEMRLLRRKAEVCLKEYAKRAATGEAQWFDKCLVLAVGAD